MNKKINVKKLCFIGMLCAVTVVLGFYATWRVGSTIKISLKFCPVFIAGSFFGPIIGGVVGAVSDLASFIANPAGGFLPLITIVEFLYGVTYGMFFYKRRGRVLPVLLCTIIQAFLLDGVFKTYALTVMMGGSFYAMLYSRLFAVAVNFVIQLVVIIILNSYMPYLKNTTKMGD